MWAAKDAPSGAYIFRNLSVAEYTAAIPPFDAPRITVLAGSARGCARRSASARKASIIIAWVLSCAWSATVFWIPRPEKESTSKVAIPAAFSSWTQRSCLALIPPEPCMRTTTGTRSGPGLGRRRTPAMVTGFASLPPVRACLVVAERDSKGMTSTRSTGAGSDGLASEMRAARRRVMGTSRGRGPGLKRRSRGERKARRVRDGGLGHSG